MSTIDSRAIDESSATDTLFFEMPLSGRDPAVFGAITEELERQKDQIELIASENIVSRAVLEAQGSVLTNKYAEGYPGRRYYGGCEFVDKAEALAIERACTLFGCNLPMCSRIRALRQSGCYAGWSRAIRSGMSLMPRTSYARCAAKSLWQMVQVNLWRL